MASDCRKHAGPKCRRVRVGQLFRLTRAEGLDLFALIDIDVIGAEVDVEAPDGLFREKRDGNQRRRFGDERRRLFRRESEGRREFGRELVLFRFFDFLGTAAPGPDRSRRVDPDLIRLTTEEVAFAEVHSFDLLEGGGVFGDAIARQRRGDVDRAIGPDVDPFDAVGNRGFDRLLDRTAEFAAWQEEVDIPALR